jgi:hypothetical protein
MEPERLHDELLRYCMPLLIPQQIGDTRAGVELVGSGSVLEIGEDIFLLTASHVVEATRRTHLLYIVEEGAGTLIGETFTFDPGQDEYDIGVVHVEGPPPRTDIDRLHLQDLYIGDTPEDVLLIGCGYPYSKNKPKYGSKTFRNLRYAIEWPALPHDRYASVGLNPNHHVALDHNIKERPNKQKLPKLNGMSGGAIWTGIGERSQVVGVIQYHDANKRVDEQAVYGTKVTVALGAIAQVFPHLAPYIPVPPMPRHLILSGRGT